MPTGAASAPREHWFNAKFACPVCNYSISELEPRLFSFNSPVGACPSCDGLGHREFFDPARVVAFPTLSLASGAIKGWDRRNAYYFALIESLAKHYRFDVDAPFEELPEAVRDVVLHGSGEEDIRFSYTMESGNQRRPQGEQEAPLRGHHPQHGAALPRDRLGRGARRAGALPQRAALPRMRRHPAAQRSPARQGGRRRAGPRHLRDRPCDAARELRVFQGLEAARRQGRDRGQGGARDRLAPEIPQRRGAELSQPGPQRRNAVGRRGPAHPAGVADRLGPDRRDVRAGRTQHRPAPARQRPPDRHAAAPARYRQQRAGGGARRGHDPRGRPCDRPGAGRRHSWRPHHGAGHL